MGSSTEEVFCATLQKDFARDHEQGFDLWKEKEDDIGDPTIKSGLEVKVWECGVYSQFTWSHDGLDARESLCDEGEGIHT